MVWRAFQLYPQIPAEGMDREAFVQARFGDPERARGAFERIRAEAEREGVELDGGRAERMPNTLRAHQLITLAGRHGVQDAMVETLFQAYFQRGEDIGALDVLAANAERVGLDAAEARRALEADEGLDEVRAEVRWAYENGVTGVPCFLLPTGFGVPGAQEPESLAKFIERGRELAEAAGVTGGACEMDLADG